MVIVIDASVAVKWVLREDGSEAAEALQTETLIAPSYWAIEAANAMWSQVARQSLEPALALKYLRKLVSGPITSVSPDEDLSRGLEIALRLKHPIYDCLYLALAIRHDTCLVTADSRFVSACTREGTWRHHVRVLAGA